MKNKIIVSHIGIKTVRNGAVLAAILACLNLSAADLNNTPASPNGNLPPRTDSTTGAQSSRADSTTTSPSGSATRSYATDHNNNGSVNHSDTSFIKEAAKGGQMEVKMGQLGVDKSQNAQVKSFSERIVKDHTQANQELMSIAQSKGVDLMADSDHSMHSMDKFSSKSGSDFDKAYIKLMVSDHKKDISQFEKEANQGTDLEVKAFAQKTLPTLREHLRMAEDLGRSMGMNAASYSTSSDDSAVGASGSISTERGASNPNNPNLDNNNKSGVDRSSQGSTSTYDRDASVTAQADTAPKTKWFSTDKNDGKLWGIFPARRHKDRQAGASVDVNAPAGSLNAHSDGQSAAGSGPSSTSGSSSSDHYKTSNN